MEGWRGDGLMSHTQSLLSRGEIEDKNVTRQPKSCYATADLLTHISRKGAGETGAKCPAARNTQAARAKRQKQHQADRLTQPQHDRKRSTTFFLSFFWEVSSKGTRKEDTGARQLLCRGSLNLLLQDMERYVLTAAFLPLVSCCLSISFRSVCF